MSESHIEQFAWRLIDLMPQLAKGLARQEHNYLTRGKITLPQVWVLEYLVRQGTSQMHNLAEYLGISRPAATGLIGRLIVQGLVARRYDRRDRRAILIAGTPKGKKVIQDILRQKHRTLVHVFGKLSVTERKQHLHIIEQMIKILNG